ncbi:hypothetical protein PYCCODRAFT_1481388 [Trametes coccinea BRFM310]|uniref:Uncharacterized protein n=1 Tax=Trametes coccinea (strain BRFM310) TaxID=1353009 RepID=A0A1Y2IA84_TRAC3|nr:hypothetical protein PYCCODRAFT_1481388 [Trametes coccinea BRFM310]
MAEHRRKIVFSPSPGAYAVIRLAPVEMVGHLGDSEAMEQAASLQTKPYLVYLLDEMSLPFPNRPWYRFDVSPIATGLRAENPGRAITPDMCIPIFPNADHPANRAPMRPMRPFPYAHCYHWFDSILQVRVRSRPEQFDETEVVKLSSAEQMELEFAWTDDAIRSADAIKARGHKPLQNVQAESCDSEAANAAPVSSSEPMPFTPKSNTSAVSPLSPEVKCLAISPQDEHDETEQVDSDHASLASSSSNASANSAADLAGLARFDIFGGTNEDVDVIPLVDLWISDLPAQLKEEDIPDPTELYAECARIVQIVKDARVRAYAAMTAHLPLAASEDQTASLSKRKRIRPGKMWAKVRVRVGRMASRLDHILQVPRKPFWP